VLTNVSSMTRIAGSPAVRATARGISDARYRGLVARVTFGRPPDAGPREAQALGADIAAQMRQLIQAHGSAPPASSPAWPS